jgi:hypothetical protein
MKRGLSAAFLAVLVTAILPIRISNAVLIREVRASQAEMKGFGYVEIKGEKWCVVLLEAELMEATAGRPMGETYFGSRDSDICRVLWRAAQANHKVDVSAVPEKAVIDPVFIGSVKKIYVIGYIWVRVR